MIRHLWPDFVNGTRDLYSKTLIRDFENWSFTFKFCSWELGQSIGIHSDGQSTYAFIYKKATVFQQRPVVVREIRVTDHLQLAG